MRWRNAEERRKEKIERLLEKGWHRHFLWFPQRIGEHDYWLRFVFRKYIPVRYSKGFFEAYGHGARPIYRLQDNGETS